MLTKEEIESLALQKYPVMWEYIPDDNTFNGGCDKNKVKRDAFIEGIMLGLTVGNRGY